MAMKCVSSRASIVQRSRGQSVIATAAYQLHKKLKDDTAGQTFYFRPKVKGEVQYSRVYLCDSAPDEFSDPERLWNSVTKAENKSSRSRTAQLARNIRICLPQGLSLAEEIDLLDRFVAPLVKDGMIVQAVIHDKGGGNPHVHLLMTMRKYKNGSWQAKSRKVYDLDAEGNRIPLIDPKTGIQKVDAKGRRQWKNHKEMLTEWNRKDLITEWRERWASICNAILPPERQITAKSYAKQAEEGITIEQIRIPTRHEGYQARKIEAAGGTSELCEYNRMVRKTNEELERLHKAEWNASWQAAMELTETRKRQGELNEQIRSIANRYIDGRRTRTDSAHNERDAGGVLSAAVEKLRAAIRSLGRGIESLRSAINNFRNRKTDLEVVGREFEVARTDAERRCNDLTAKLAKRRTLGLSGRKDRRNRRNSR